MRKLIITRECCKQIPQIRALDSGVIHKYKCVNKGAGSTHAHSLLHKRTFVGVEKASIRGLTLVPCPRGKSMGILRGLEELDLVPWGAYTAR